MNEIPEKPSSAPEAGVELPADDQRILVKAAKANLKQAKSAVKIAKKAASEAKKQVKALRKSKAKK